jgi:hypothetical protein
VSYIDPSPLGDLPFTNWRAIRKAASRNGWRTCADKKRVVTAKYPNHVWHVDLTMALILAAF